METKKYIMWGDGVITSFGELKEKISDNIIRVKNPVNIIFQVENVPVCGADGKPQVGKDGKPEVNGYLKWEMNPYIFGACLTDSNDNIWTCETKFIISDDAEYDERLIQHYNTLIGLCDRKPERVATTTASA